MNSEYYSISLAGLSDLEEVHQLIRKCANYLLKSGLKQWDNNYPGIDLLKNDIEAQTLYIFKNSNLVLGAVVANKIQDKEYQEVEWQDKTNNFLVIHRLGVDPDAQRKGIGRKLMNHIEVISKAKGISSIRLDTYSLNPTSIQFYKSLAYKELTRIHLPYQSELFICFEKLID